jgi:ABC-2 type transport system permease protein
MIHHNKDLNLNYRSWSGTFRPPAWSVWPIARTALWMIFRRKLFWVLYALGLLIFMLFFFGQYLVALAETQADQMGLPTTTTEPSAMRQMAREDVRRFARALRENPRLLGDLLRNGLKLNGTGAMYRNFFWYQGYIIMVVLALAGSILVGNDIHHGSLPFYLSKPLSHRHYLLGKGLAVAVFINLVTTLPALFLFVQYGMLYSWDYLTDNLALAAGILGYGVLLSVSLSLLLLAVAVWVRRTVPMILVWTAVFFFCRQLSRAVVDLLHYDPRWRLLDLWNDLYLVGSVLLGIDPRDIGPREPAWSEGALVLGGVCALCLTYLIRRIRAVEIVS